jgi:hypothetical protein
MRTFLGNSDASGADVGTCLGDTSLGDTSLGGTSLGGTSLGGTEPRMPDSE